MRLPIPAPPARSANRPRAVMPVNILMPALSPTMEKGNLARWLKQEGDQVKAGDVIAEIETDKATMEYESIDDGVLAKIVVAEGTQDVPVNQLIAVLAQEGEDPKAAAATAGKGAAPAAKPADTSGKTTGAGAPSPQPSPPRREAAGSVSPQAERAPALSETGAAASENQGTSSPQAERTPSRRGGEGWGEGARTTQTGANR